MTVTAVGAPATVVMVLAEVAVQAGAVQVPRVTFGIPVNPATLLGWKVVDAVDVVAVAAAVATDEEPKLDGKVADAAPVPVSTNLIVSPA